MGLCDWLVEMADDAALTRLDVLLDELEDAAADNVERGRLIQSRIHELRESLAAGVSVGDAVIAEAEPRTVELISTNMAMLEDTGSKFRACLAQALRDDGFTVETIGQMFGVSRQRISALLRQKAAIDQ